MSGLYIQMHSMHGLFRGQNVELGRDSDTGGQIIYVLELAQWLGKQPGVRKVDIITRYIHDPQYPGYDKLVEPVSKNVDIIRIKAGGELYMRKEELWPHLDEFVENTIAYITQQNDTPSMLHSNYADSGKVCTLLSRKLGIPQIHTGHSLGKPKMQRIGITDENRDHMEDIYKFAIRIAAEEETFQHASAIIVSSQQERIEQYGVYNIDVNNHKFRVIPPGIDTAKFFSYRKEGARGLKGEKLRRKFGKEFRRWLKWPKKPIILNLTRLDHRKNIPGLVKAYGMDAELQGLANLVIFAGQRSDPHALSDAEKQIMIDVFFLIDKYDLYGKIALPKYVNFKEEVPELYRIIAERRGIFVNPAFTEPFGITLIEAAASGLPVVATNDGGPNDIISNCHNGILVDVDDPQDMARAMCAILADARQWKRYSQAGLEGTKEHYTWEAAAKKQVALFREILAKQ